MHFAKVCLTNPSEGNNNFNVSANCLFIKGSGDVEKTPEHNSDGVRTAAACLLLRYKRKHRAAAAMCHTADMNSPHVGQSLYTPLGCTIHSAPILCQTSST